MSCKNIVELLGEIAKIQKDHVFYVELREARELKDPEDDEAITKYDEDLEEWENRIEEIKDEITEVVSKLSITREW